MWGNEQIFSHTLCEEAVSHIWLCNRSLLDFLIYEENSVFFFISATEEKPMVFFSYSCPMIKLHKSGNQTNGIAAAFCHTKFNFALQGGNGNTKNERWQQNWQWNVDGYGPRHIPNICHLPYPLWFSLQTTFSSSSSSKFFIEPTLLSKLS